MNDDVLLVEQTLGIYSNQRKPEHGAPTAIGLQGIYPLFDEGGVVGGDPLKDLPLDGAAELQPLRQGMLGRCIHGEEGVGDDL